MTEIFVKQLSKRYGYQWVVKDFDSHFQSDKIYGIAGKNGSGKSTLIKMISGYLTPTTGEIQYILDNKRIGVYNIYKYVSLAAPYTDLINEFTLSEMFYFHCKFKKLHKPLTFKEFETVIHLPNQKEKTLQHFSSGMKQKIQLALAILSDTPIILLDEPTSFLDQFNKEWFADLLNNFKNNRIVIIASNDPYDLAICEDVKFVDTAF